MSGHFADLLREIRDVFGEDVVAELERRIRFQSERHDFCEQFGDAVLALRIKLDRKSTRLNSSHTATARMPSSA